MLKGTEKIWDSSIANIGILFVNQYLRDRIPAYVNAIYPLFWRRELYIEDVDVVKRCLEEAEVAPTAFDDFFSGDGKTIHYHMFTHRLDAGMYGMPTYVYDEGDFLSASTCTIVAGS